jgi:hypothetical protein
MYLFILYVFANQQVLAEQTQKQKKKSLLPPSRSLSRAEISLLCASSEAAMHEIGHQPF